MRVTSLYFSPIILISSDSRFSLLIVKPTENYFPPFILTSSNSYFPLAILTFSGSYLSLLILTTTDIYFYLLDVHLFRWINDTVRPKRHVSLAPYSLNMFFTPCFIRAIFIYFLVSLCGLLYIVYKYLRFENTTPHTSWLYPNLVNLHVFKTRDTTN